MRVPDLQRPKSTQLLCDANNAVARTLGSTRSSLFHSAKTQLLIGIGLAFGQLSSDAQLPLTAGDVFTFEFSTLPFRANVFGPAPEGLFQFSLDDSTLQPEDLLRFEMFEGSLAVEPSLGPICSGTVNGPPAPGAWPCVVPGAWQDLQGTVRFTMLAGSVTLDRFELGVLRQGGPTLAQWYSEIVTPVPEPCVAALAVLGAACAVVRKGWRHEDKAVRAKSTEKQ